MAFASQEWTKDLLKKAKEQGKLGSGGTDVVVTGSEYSTEELCIGKWIDGKPIYRKVYQFTTTRDEIHEYPLGISFDNIVSYFGYVIFNGITMPFNSAWTEGMHLEAIIRKNTNSLSIKCDNLVELPMIHILEYTKTTDAPNSFTVDMLTNTLGLLSPAEFAKF